MENDFYIKEVSYVDEELRSYLMKVYTYMALGLGLTGLIAYWIASTPSFFEAIFETPLIWAILIAPLFLVYYIGSRINILSPSIAQILFWVYAILIGTSLAPIIILYTGQSIAHVFLITSASFAAMSLFGYNTKTDLSSLKSFMIMGLLGLIFAGIINLFLQNTSFDFVISGIGVLLFVVLTAVDIQDIKNLYFSDDLPEITEKKAIMGALTLYLNYLNLFLYLLRFFGRRRKK
jgi:FtsH-binding integral membrane protein